MEKLDTEYGTLADLLKTPKIFEIPVYQRQFSWTTKDQVAHLWSDIVRLYVALNEDGAKDDHFIGPVVIGESPPKALGAAIAPVIDGQQRLITLSLLIAAIRDVLVADNAVRKQVTTEYLTTVSGKSSDTRIRPALVDRDAYERIIRSKQINDSKSKVSKAYQYFVDRLTEGPQGTAQPMPEDPQDEDADRELDEELEVEESSAAAWTWDQLLQIVTTQLFLVSITGVPSESAYQIFSTLNSTGLRLAQVDLVRNAVFMLLPTKASTEFATSWEPLQSAMSPQLLEQYLHSWVVRKGYNVPQKGTYRSFMRELGKPGVSEASVSEHLSDLHAEAWSFLLISRPEDKGARKSFANKLAPHALTQVLSRLATWGSVPMQPLLLEIITRWQSDRLDLAATKRLCEALESFVVRRFILQIPPNDLRSVFARIVIQVRTESDGGFENKLLEALSESKRRWPTDAELRDACRDRHLYRPKAQKQVFFVLRRVAEHLEGKECPHLVLGTGANDFSIEHVMPQGGLTPEWRADLKRWRQKSMDDNWRKFVHSIGNLTLTAYNSELSNKPFGEKQDFIRANSTLKLSKQITESGVKTWTTDDIEDRSASLANHVIKIWRAPGS